MIKENNEINRKVELLIKEQLEGWDLAHKNFGALENAHERIVSLGEHIQVILQHNPERIRSTTAKTDIHNIPDESLCFLCQANRPVQQLSVPYPGNIEILVNPYPIFRKHLTIVSKTHTPQSIRGHFETMLSLANDLWSFSVFYNGPACGASAPIHFHFQAGDKYYMPVEREFELQDGDVLIQTNNSRLIALDNYLRKVLVLRGNNAQELSRIFKQILGVLEKLMPGETEPMLNIICCRAPKEWRTFIFPRGSHRPSQFFLEGTNQILLSPAAVEMGGVVSCPRAEDFEKLDSKLITDIFRQVSVSNPLWESIKTSITQSEWK